jgi:hypothetical protein
MELKAANLRIQSLREVVSGGMRTKNVEYYSGLETVGGSTHHNPKRVHDLLRNSITIVQ